MSEAPSAAPHYRTGALWGVLALLLLIGTVSAAFFVFGLTDLLGTGHLFPDVPISDRGRILRVLLDAPHHRHPLPGGSAEGCPPPGDEAL